MQWSEPAIAPVGEARSNHAVMADLAVRLGLDDPSLAVSEEALAQEIAGHARVDFETVQRDKVVNLPSLVQLVDVMPSRPITLVGALGAPRFRPPPSMPIGR